MQTNIQDFLFEQAEESEEKRVTPKPLDEERLLAAIDELCPGFDLRDTANFPVLYRGSDSKVEMALWPARPERLSKYGIGSKKLVNMLVDEWQGWPKRSRSVFVANQRRNATYFGSGVHVIIPRLNTKIAVCSSEDFVNTPPQVQNWLQGRVYTLNSLSRCMASMIRKVAEIKKINIPGNKYGWSGPDTLHELQEQLAIVDTHRKALWAHVMTKDMAWDTDGNYALMKTVLTTSGMQPLFDYFTEMLAPGPNDFVQLQYGHSGWLELDIPPQGNELWFEGEYIAIEMRKCQSLSENDPRFTLPDR